MRIDSFTAVTLNSICAPTDSSFFMKHSSADLLEFRDKLRLGYDAIIVGANTIIKDNPALLNKSMSNVRIVIDDYQNLSLQERIFTRCPERTIVITPFRLCETHYIKRLVTIGVNVVTVEDTKNLAAIVAALEEMGISKFWKMEEENQCKRSMETYFQLKNLILY
jgi:riboflavin biosynthesis pyrimidine reductase